MPSLSQVRDVLCNDSLRLISLLDPLIQRLQNSSVHSGDHIDCGIQLFLGHSRFPCVRKAALHSRVAEAHRRDRQPDQYLLPLAKTLHRMGVAIKSSKVGLFQIRYSCSMTSV